MASAFDSFSTEGDQIDPMTHVQGDHIPPNSRPFDDDGYMGDDSSFPADTPLPTEISNDDDKNNMHSGEAYGFGMPEPSPQFASPFETEMPEVNGGNGVFVSDGPILPEPSQMQEEGTKFREWRR